jgi:hypothetical protein
MITITHSALLVIYLSDANQCQRLGACRRVRSLSDIHEEFPWERDTATQRRMSDGTLQDRSHYSAS